MVQTSKREQWTKLLNDHQTSGLPVRRFCSERGVGVKAFYYWRKRVPQNPPVGFALLETTMASQPVPLELVLTSGERLRFGGAVSAELLRTVLEAVRR